MRIRPQKGSPGVLQGQLPQPVGERVPEARNYLLRSDWPLPILIAESARSCRPHCRTHSKDRLLVPPKGSLPEVPALVPEEALHAEPLDRRQDGGQVVLHRGQEQATALLPLRACQVLA